MSAIRRSVVCTCGGDIYDKTIGDDAALSPVWTCENCGRTTPRARRRVLTNHAKALQACIAIREAWTDTDAALTRLVDAGVVKSGALLVHASAFNHHLNKLMDLPKPSNFEVRYHIEGARRELQAAADFVRDAETK